MAPCSLGEAAVVSAVQGPVFPGQRAGGMTLTFGGLFTALGTC